MDEPVLPNGQQKRVKKRKHAESGQEMCLEKLEKLEKLEYKGAAAWSAPPCCDAH